MPSVDPALKDRLDALVSRLTREVGDALRGVVVYGSAVGGGYKPGKSNVNLLVVVEPHGPSAARAVGRALAAEKDELVVAHVTSPAGLRRLGHTFPIQLAEMKDHHLCLVGETQLGDLAVTRAALLADAERELAAVVRRMSMVLVAHGDDPRRLAKAVRKNFRSLVHAFRGALRAVDELPPTTDKHPTLARAATRFGLDGDALVRLLDFRRRNEPTTRAGLEALVTTLLESAEKTAHAVSQLAA